jgi:hypothetical protein
MRRSLGEQHPVLLGLGILFVLGVVVAYWPIFVAAGIAYGVYLAARAAVRRHRRRQWEHAAILAGDTWLGTYGQYSPALVTVAKMLAVR